MVNRSPERSDVGYVQSSFVLVIFALLFEYDCRNSSASVVRFEGKEVDPDDCWRHEWPYAVASYLPLYAAFAWGRR